MKIVSFNLRCSWDKDDINSFIHRGGMILEKINEEKPDVICFQEGTDKNIAFLRRALPDYDIVFNQRNADYTGEGLATALRRDSVTLLGLSFFWLSNTPDVPGSRFPIQSPCPRVCQSLLVRSHNGSMLRLYNVHLDHVSDSARILGIRCLFERIEKDNATAAFPLFILGDFNARPDGEPIRFCNEYESLPITDLTSGIDGTFHGYGRKGPYKIDYIYVDRKTAAQNHTVTLWKDERDGIFLSDHYPIALDIEL